MKTMDSVYFRTFEEEDWCLVYKWLNDDKLNKLSVGLNRRLSKDECKSWVNKRINHSAYEVWWAVCSREDDTLIGYTYLTNIHYINRSAEFGGIVIGDSAYQDGFAWMETYLFVLEYSFARLNLNRLYGYYLSEHNLTKIMCQATFFKTEGVHKEAIYKNGKYHDQIDIAILAREYYSHLNNGDYKISNIIKRVVRLKKEKENNSSKESL